MIHLFLVLDHLYIDFDDPRPRWDVFLPYGYRPTCCKASVISCSLGSAINFRIQGIYPTTIVTVVAMQLSAADTLSRSGAQADSLIVIPPRPPSPEPRIGEDVQPESPLDGRLVDVSSDATTPRVLALSIPDKNQ